MNTEHSPRTEDAQNGSACEAAPPSQQRSNRSSTSKKARTTTGGRSSSSFTHGPGPSTPSSARASESSFFMHPPDTSATTSAGASRSSSFMHGPDPSTTFSARASGSSSSFKLRSATDPSTPSARTASDTDAFTPADAARRSALAELAALQASVRTANEKLHAANATLFASGAHVANSTPQCSSKRGRGPNSNCTDDSHQFASSPAFSFHHAEAVYSPAARSHSLAGGLQTQADDVDTKLQLEHLFYKEEKRECENRRNSYNSAQAESARISALESQASDLIDLRTFQRLNIQERLQATARQLELVEEEAQLKDGKIEHATKKWNSMHEVLTYAAQKETEAFKALALQQRIVAGLELRQDAKLTNNCFAGDDISEEELQRIFRVFSIEDFEYLRSADIYKDYVSVLRRGKHKIVEKMEYLKTYDGSLSSGSPTKTFILKHELAALFGFRVPENWLDNSGYPIL